MVSPFVKQKIWKGNVLTLEWMVMQRIGLTM